MSKRLTEPNDFTDIPHEDVRAHRGRSVVAALLAGTVALAGVPTRVIASEHPPAEQRDHDYDDEHEGPGDGHDGRDDDGRHDDDENLGCGGQGGQDGQGDGSQAGGADGDNSSSGDDGAGDGGSYPSDGSEGGQDDSGAGGNEAGGSEDRDPDSGGDQEADTEDGDRGGAGGLEDGVGGGSADDDSSVDGRPSGEGPASSDGEVEEDHTEYGAVLIHAMGGHFESVSEEWGTGIWGTLMRRFEVEGERVTLPEPVRAGYDFCGWYLVGGGGHGLTPAGIELALPDGIHRFLAVWAPEGGGEPEIPVDPDLPDGDDPESPGDDESGGGQGTPDGDDTGGEGSGDDENDAGGEVTPGGGDEDPGTSGGDGDADDGSVDGGDGDADDGDGSDDGDDGDGSDDDPEDGDGWDSDDEVTPVASSVTIDTAGGTFASAPAGWSTGDSLYELVREFEPGMDLIMLPAPTMEGFDLLGWRLVGDVGDRLYQPGDRLALRAGNHTFVAQWGVVAIPDGPDAPGEDQGRVYTLAIDMAGGTFDEAPAGWGTGDHEFELTREFVATDSAIALPTPRRDGYTFLGWQRADSPDSPALETVVVVPADTPYSQTYVAQWAAIEDPDVPGDGEGDVVFGTASIDMAGGTFDEAPVGWGTGDHEFELTREFEVGMELVELPEPSRTGYEFLGWLMDGDVSGRLYQPGDRLALRAGSHTFVAQWQLIDAPGDDEQDTSYTVTIDTEGGTFDVHPEGWDAGADTDMYAREFVATDDVIVLPTPERDEHDFVGWKLVGQDDETADPTVSVDPMVAQYDHDFVAVWAADDDTGVDEGVDEDGTNGDGAEGDGAGADGTGDDGGAAVTTTPISTASLTDAGATLRTASSTLPQTGDGALMGATGMGIVGALMALVGKFLSRREG